MLGARSGSCHTNKKMPLPFNPYTAVLRIRKVKISGVILLLLVTITLLLTNEWNPGEVWFVHVKINRGHYMAARRYEISLRVLKNISATVIFSHVKISGFRAKAHLVFHWCLYNKCIYLITKSEKRLLQRKATSSHKK